MNNLIRYARVLPAKESEQTVSISPVVLPVPERGQPLEMRITAPVPLIAGRLDRQCVAAVGHSMGGQTLSSDS